MTATSGGWFVRTCTLVLVVIGCQSAPASDSLPRFTEEREAAALHFVRKHCPELIPLLEDLKKSHRATYERQIRETFQITEYLADLHDDEKRYDLELKVWKAENKAMVLVARLATAREDDRKAIEGQLRALAKELVELDIKAMEHRVEVLDHELTAAREELAKSRDGMDRSVREKFEGFLEKAKKKRGAP